MTGFKKRAKKNEKIFAEGANKSSQEVKLKNFNMRFSKEEIDILRSEAEKNHRSMQQHLKHLLWNSIEPETSL